VTDVVATRGEADDAHVQLSVVFTFTRCESDFLPGEMEWLCSNDKFMLHYAHAQVMKNKKRAACHGTAGVFYYLF
jgi:hypothetical protein